MSGQADRPRAQEAPSPKLSLMPELQGQRRLRDLADGSHSESSRARALSSACHSSARGQSAGTLLAFRSERPVAVLSAPLPWALRHFVKWGASGGAIASGPGRDLIGLPRWLDSLPRGLSRQPHWEQLPCLPGDSLPTGASAQPAIGGAARGGAQPPGDGGRNGDKLPFKRQSGFKMPSCSSDCFFLAAVVGFF